MKPVFKQLISLLSRPLSANWRARLWYRLRGQQQAALLAHVDTCLLVFDDRLYHLADGSWCSITESRPGLEAAAQLASAAARLLEARPSARGIALLLPPDGFAATRVALPGVAADAVAPALMLQVDNLLPAVNEPLALAVNPARQQTDGAEVALWMSQNRLVALGEAFAARGMPLLAVLPRQLLALATTAGTGRVEDDDGRMRTVNHWQAGALDQWLQVAEQDLQEPAFASQWQQSLAALPADINKQHHWRGVDDYLAFVQAHGSRALPAAYCFIPPVARQQQQRQQRRQLASRVSIVALLLFSFASLPWLWQSWQLWRLESALARQYPLSAPARENQFVVRDFELRWGAYLDFPHLDMTSLMFTLQSLVSPNVLTVLALSDGELQIEGQSSDPQALLQRLAAHADFADVRFVRATSNDRYVIALRLRALDFESYDDWYLAERF